MSFAAQGVAARREERSIGEAQASVGGGASAYRRSRPSSRPSARRISADVPRAQATGLLSAALAHDGWCELVDGQGLSWDDPEAWLVTALARALLVPEVDAADSFKGLAARLGAVAAAMARRVL